jgi:glycosyltransferase involved in cell wall biosynthesis
MNDWRNWQEPFGLPFLLAFALFPITWLGLNAGLWTIQQGSPLDVGFYRALAPVACLLAAGALIVRTQGAQRGPGLFGPLGLLTIYGLVGLLSGIVLSPDPATSTYWGLSFLAVPVVGLALAATPRDEDHLRYLALATLSIVVAIALLLFVIALSRGWLDALFSMSLYREFGSYDNDVASALAINANGAGRFIGLATLATGYLAMAREGSRAKVVWGGLAAILTPLFVYTQSRTSFLAFIAGAALLGAILWGWKRAVAASGAAGIGLVALVGPMRLWEVVNRGQSAHQIKTLNGRTEMWSEIVSAGLASPITGLGFHADRLVTGMHTHNGLVHSFVTAGLLGLLLFAAAWILAWRGSIKAGLLSRFEALPDGHRDTAIMATVVLAFLTVRSITESTGAFFGVDLLVFAPTAAYLYALGAAEDEPAASDTPSPGDASQPRSVLASAYACAPPGSPTFHGGEELLGWKMVTELADERNVHVLTSREHRPSIEAKRHELAATLHFHYVGLPDWLDWMRDHQGAIQLYAYLWQFKAYFVGRKLHAQHGFDLFHHITYANDWMASHLGALLPIPYVRGPGGGAQSVPDELGDDVGWQFRAGQRIRGTLQGVLRRDPFFWMGQERAGLLLACCPEVADAVPERWHRKVRLFRVNGIDPSDIPDSTGRKGDGPFTVLAPGKLLKIKGFHLAIDAFSRSQAAKADGRLVIAGDGPEREPLVAQADELGVAESVEFTGWLDREILLEQMAEADVVLFPGLRDGGGAVVVEAMATGTPVVCLDHGGPGLHVTEETGIAVPPADPDGTIDALADALDDLHGDPTRRASMGRRARHRALEDYTWSHHGERIDELYAEANTG